MKKFASFAVVTIVFVSFFSVNAFALKNHETGDVVEFGSYPQTQVTDEKLIEKLMGQHLDWKSYGYYCSYNGENVGAMRESDFSMYADVELGGEKYRAVRLTAYFPDVTFDSCPLEAEYCCYETDWIYWFKYEPIEWVVLDAEEGLLFSKMILDSRPFHFKVYDGGKYLYGDASCATFPEDYSASDIREWLNNDFYNTAFTGGQQKNIIKTDLVDDSKYLTGYFKNKNASLYGSAQQDSVYLLSYSEAINSDYGFDDNFENNDPARERKGTDYSKLQGLSVYDESELSPWYTRTSGYNCMPLAVENGDIVCEDDFSTFIYGTGICPAIRVSSLSVGIFDSIGSLLDKNKNESPSDGASESNGGIGIVGLIFIVIAVSAITSVITSCIVKRKTK